jgi:hypothetical protein
VALQGGERQIKGSELFAIRSLFQSPDCEQYSQLLRDLMPFEQQFDSGLAIFFDWFQHVAASVASRKVLILAQAIMRNFTLNVNQIEILVRVASSDDSTDIMYHVCELAILALEKDSDSLPLLMESVLPAVLTFESSMNPE